MKRWNSNYGFWLVCGGLLLLGATETWTIVSQIGAARKADGRLSRAGRELRTIVSESSSDAASLDTELERGRKILAGLREQLDGNERGENASAAPGDVTRAQTFFDVASFIERMRETARRCGVKLKPDERFGFSVYSHDAPGSDELALVGRDLANLRAMLAIVLEARPEELVAVEREQSANSRRTVLPASDSKGTFTVDPRWTLRTPDDVRTSAYRLSFLGDTSVLREVLNGLAGADRALWVRLVEVVRADGSTGAAMGISSGAVGPLRRNSARFTVVVEAISTAGRNGAES